MKTMKAMRTMKTKRISKIARGKYAKALVFRGSRERTSGGLNKGGLTKNKAGKIVSKKMSAAAKGRYAYSIKAWNMAVKAARKALSITGFVALNGKSGQGKAFYAK